MPTRCRSPCRGSPTEASSPMRTTRPPISSMRRGTPHRPPPATAPVIGGHEEEDLDLIDATSGQTTVLSRTALDGEWAADGTLVVIDTTQESTNGGGWMHEAIRLEGSTNFLLTHGQDQVNN